MSKAGKAETSSRLSRQQWVEAALFALAEGGVEAMRVEPLAKTLGVTKGSFYWHFADRQDLHLAALEFWEDVATNQIIEHIEITEPADPERKLRALIQLTFDADPTHDAIEGAVRAWAQQDVEAAEVAARVDRRRLRYVAGLLRQCGQPANQARNRSRLLYRTMIGEFMWRSTGGPGSSRSELDDLATLITSGDPST